MIRFDVSGRSVVGKPDFSLLFFSVLLMLGHLYAVLIPSYGEFYNALAVVFCRVCRLEKLLLPDRHVELINDKLLL